MRASRAAWRCISCFARLMRAGMTRVEAYSSKLLRNVPRWRRSKASTAPSGVRPANALSTTERETPAAAASRATADRKVLKSPPHVAAPADAARSRVQNRMPRDRNSMPLLQCSFSRSSLEDTAAPLVRPAGKEKPRPRGVRQPAQSTKAAIWPARFLKLQKTGNPSLHLCSIGSVFGSKYLLQPNFVVQHAPMEPVCAASEDDKCEPGPKCQREAQHEDQMSEIHRIACETIGALRDYPLWWDVHAGSAPGTRQSIAADVQILQVSPDKQRHAPRYEDQWTLAKSKLEDDHNQRAQDESLHRRSPEPVKSSVASRLQFLLHQPVDGTLSCDSRRRTAGPAAVLPAQTLAHHLAAGECRTAGFRVGQC